MVDFEELYKKAVYSALDIQEPKTKEEKLIHRYYEKFWKNVFLYIKEYDKCLEEIRKELIKFAQKENRQRRNAGESKQIHSNYEQVSNQETDERIKTPD